MSKASRLAEEKFAEEGKDDLEGNAELMADVLQYEVDRNMVRGATGAVREVLDQFEQQYGRRQAAVIVNELLDTDDPFVLTFETVRYRGAKFDVAIVMTKNAKEV